MTDPAAQGGEYYAPAGPRRGLPTRIEPLARTHSPDRAIAASVWTQLEEPAGVRMPVPTPR